MAKIIDFKRARERMAGTAPDDLTTLMKQASLLLKKSDDDHDTIKEGRPGHVFEGVIMREIFSRKLVGSDVLLCGIYVAKLMEELVSDVPKSWWAIDYVSDDPLSLKSGGDVCFILCSVFQERCDHRMMNYKYYKNMGISFYYKFYRRAEKEIGYYMSNQFQTMTSVVQSCIKSLQRGNA